jgi:hypothetical protein
MTESPASSDQGVSPSVQAAFDWSVAVARVRSATPKDDPDPQPSPEDLLVGTMLAHPDEDGEVRVLLTHFDLTLRDVVGDTYARLTPANLDLAAAASSGWDPARTGPAAQLVATAARGAGGGRIQLLQLLGGMLGASTELTTRFEAAFASVGESRAAVASSYDAWLATRPQENDIAGRALREWLREHSPREPVSVPAFSTDDVANPDLQQQDLIGISAESNALAYLVSSRDLVPPLAVGLFGDWGSGKSFLMRDVRQRMHALADLSAQQPQRDASVWKNIEHIEFNAWEYVQEDLWAGLLEKIFARLGTRVKVTSLVEAKRKPLDAQLADQKLVVRRAEEASSGLTKQLESVEIEVQRAHEVLLDRKEQATAARDGVDVDLKVLTDTVLAELWTHDRVRQVGGDAQELMAALEVARDEARRDRVLLGAYWKKWWRMAILALTLVLVPGVALLVQELTSVGELTSLLAGLAAAVPVLTGWLTAFTNWSQRRRQAIEDARIRVGAKLEEPVREAEQAVAAAEGRRAEIAHSLAEQQATLLLEKQRAEELTARLRTLTPGRVLADFADDRSDDYRRRLGLLGSVRDDLRTLEEQIHTSNGEALAASEPAEEAGDAVKVPNRIVLYIDDLDRCPPGKVVQVLEAVHLLLAFSMFVVFVAVDSRWLSAALVDELHALRPPGGQNGDGTRPAAVDSREQRDTPTARDYLEKIFQLPFWVQPLSSAERSTIVSGLLQPAVRAAGGGAGQDGPTGLTVDEAESTAIEAMLMRSGTGLRVEASPLSLSTDELEFIASLGPLLGDTPRRVKRFVNTVQFLLSIRPPLGEDGPTPPRMAAALFAAIHEGLPSLAGEVFHEGRRDVPLQSSLARPGVVDAERDRLRQWLATHPAWNQAKLDLIGERAGIVQRLGFGRPAAQVRFIPPSTTTTSPVR